MHGCRRSERRVHVSFRQRWDDNSERRVLEVQRLGFAGWAYTTQQNKVCSLARPVVA